MIPTRLKIWFLKRTIKGNEPMKKLFSWLQGKKTHITAIMIGVSAGLSALDIEIPKEVWAILGALGLTSLRDGISKSGKK